jgi:16S rRNA (cytosine1402-N4)-methyltransferase
MNQNNQSHAGHVPVLKDEVIGYLTAEAVGQIMDCTLGLGGHALALLESLGKDARLVGMDADEGNVSLARQRLGPFGSQVRFFHANFSEVRQVLREVEWTGVDALLADLGFCSTQMDDPQRGLSFMQDGPLDMRLDLTATKTAADIVNRTAERDLADLIYQNADERFSRRIARAVVLARSESPITRTAQLAEIVKRSMPAAVRRNRTGVHPATRTFQAIRIAVNDELGALDRLLSALPEILNPGGHAAIISFHSLEDARVKRAFAEYELAGLAKRLTKKPITASDEEIEQNPRSRSAKLRVLRWE